MKEETRIEGPWEYGVKPKVNQNSASVQEANERKASKNREILDQGAEYAV